MKRLLITVFIGFQLIGAAWAQNDEQLESVKAAMKAGSAKELAKFFNESVDLNLNNNQTTYSKAQAEFVLRDFFKANPVTDFSFLHKGSSKSGQPYAIGQYKSGASNYRVFIKFKVVGAAQQIHEISFSKE
ncbi:MAG: DUF4783 domain-containing protein [Chryseotalea sp.]|jgi:hypothetical protein